MTAMTARYTKLPLTFDGNFPFSKNPAARPAHPDVKTGAMDANKVPKQTAATGDAGSPLSSSSAIPSIDEQ
jgi:hypothetical protein